MRFLILLLTFLFITPAHSLEILNPYKGGSLAIELYATFTKLLDSKNIKYNMVTLDNCRAIPVAWTQHKSPLTITWSDTKECNAQATNINIFSKATQLFCAAKDNVDLSKPNLKIGWQGSAPLTGIYETIESRYGKHTKVPYLNSGQQIQGVISEEIDVALIGQGSAFTSNLKCFMATTPFENYPVLEHSWGDMYASLIGILYEDKTLESIVKEFINLPEMKFWKAQRKLLDINSDNERKFYIDNAYNRR
jgi:hypothetical protein